MIVSTILHDPSNPGPWLPPDSVMSETIQNLSNMNVSCAMCSASHNISQMTFENCFAS